MTGFKSWRSYEDFEKKVKEASRYRYDTATESFLETILSTARARSKSYRAGTLFWRAQRGCRFVNGHPLPYKRSRMKPLPDRAPEGRINPKGIPYLYLATDRDTAIGELRPWVNQYVSVALFKTCRDLTVVNCISPSLVRPTYTNEEPNAKKREESVWTTMDEAFARPVARDNDEIALYAPTQILAELLKEDGWDGILYPSWLGKGQNVALFDLDAATVTDCRLFKVVDARFDSREVEPADGQTLRDRLLVLYGWKCAVTGCGPDWVLDVSCIWPDAPSAADKPDNGLLLRVDIRRLFDAGLLRIHPRTRKVFIDPSLKGTSYWSLNGETLRQRTDGKWPRRKYLQNRWERDSQTTSYPPTIL